MDQPQDWVWPFALTVVAITYAVLALRLRAQGRWPARRVALFYAGLVVAALALVGPVADPSHESLTRHMVGHLLLGMLAPILLVLSAPVSLLLRALPVPTARRVVRSLATPPFRFLTHPLVAATLNVGGLWLLYRTDLYTEIHREPWVGIAVHLHVLLAGYLFTLAMIGIDPLPHRPSRLLRAIVLVGALGAHAVLAKSLFGHPPAGVAPADAETAAQLMYYGGDAVDLILIVVFCHQWYRVTRPRPDVSSVRADLTGRAPGTAGRI